MHTIYISFSRRHNIIEDMACFFHKGRYSHAAISLIGTEGPFYSFNLKGFRLEHPTDSSACYSIDISDEQYLLAESYMNELQQEHKKWHFSLLGVFLAIMRIPHRFKNHRFCSQFIMELLQRAKIIPSVKRSSTTLPNDLYYALVINNLVAC